MSWFKEIFGFSEQATDHKGKFDVVKRNCALSADGCTLTTAEEEFKVGVFETPTLGELRTRIEKSINIEKTNENRLKFRHMVGDVYSLHQDPKYRNAVFQVASQFNCLEMVGPTVRPEDGITRYINDKTQGPACALACPAATLYRNYFVPISSKTSAVSSPSETTTLGQAGGSARQINLLRDIGRILKNSEAKSNNSNKYWTMQNGYCMPCSSDGIRNLSNMLRQNETLQLEVKEALRVGIHWDTEVSSYKKNREKRNRSKANSSMDISDVKSKTSTISKPQKKDINEKEDVDTKNDTSDSELQVVCQVFCSALPVSYTKVRSSDWKQFAQLILTAAYEATFAAALLKMNDSNPKSALQDLENEDFTVKRQTVILTKLGGGAFGNRSVWIVEAIQNALNKFAHSPLDVVLLHYGNVDNQFNGLKVLK